MDKKIDVSLVEDIKFWRAERPDEWTMDRFIRKAKELEAENKRYNEALKKIACLDAQGIAQEALNPKERNDD